MKKISLFVLLLIAVSSFAGSRLHYVKIFIHNFTNATWYLHGDPYVHHGSIKNSDGMRMIKPGQVAFINGWGNGHHKGGPQPYFDLNLSYSHDAAFFLMHLFSNGSTSMSVDGAGNEARAVLYSEHCSRHCNGEKIGHTCAGYTYHNCSMTVNIEPPKKHNVSIKLRGSFSKFDLLNWSKQFYNNLSASVRQCLQKNAKGSYISYSNDPKNHQTIFNFTVQCKPTAG